MSYRPPRGVPPKNKARVVAADDWRKQRLEIATSPQSRAAFRRRLVQFEREVRANKVARVADADRWIKRLRKGKQ